MNTYLHLMREDNSIEDIITFPNMSPKQFINGLQNEKHRFIDFINLIGNFESIVKIRVYNEKKLTNSVIVHRDYEKGILEFKYCKVKNEHLFEKGKYSENFLKEVNVQ